MAFLRGEHAGSRLILTTVLVAAATQAAVAGILTALTVTTLDGTGISNAAVAACVLDFIALAISAPVGIFINGSSAATRTRTRSLALAAVSFVTVLTACVLTIYVLAYIWVETLDQPGSKTNPGNGLTIAGFAIWALNALLQAFTHLIMALRKPSTPSAPPPTQEVTERQSPRVRRPKSVHLKSIGTPPFSRPDAALASPTLTGYLDSPSSARSSFRHSLHQVIRPITSRTKLLRMQSPPPQPRQPFPATPRRQDTSLDFGCRGDGFETWDTSAVEENFITPFSISPSPKLAPGIRKGSLPPIPGSRPVSPAKALQGPFHIPDYQQPSSRPHTPPVPPSSDDDSLPSTATSSEDTAPRLFAESEAHIHPLFRMHSPTPAPNPSPGTVVEMDGAEMPRRLGSGASSTRSAAGSRKGSVGQGRGPSALGTQVVIGGGEGES